MSTKPAPWPLEIAEKLDGPQADWHIDLPAWAADQLRQLYQANEQLEHENADLRAQLEAIGAGGVEPLRKRHDHIEVSLRMVTKGGRSMTTQHAPGPWTANTQTTRIQVNSRNVTVAHVMGIDAKAQADAYLMAAAPELLAALKDARRKLAWFTGSYPQDIVVSETEFFGPIDAAITKAEGA